MIEARLRNSDRAPAMDRRHGRFDHPRDGAGASERIKDRDSSSAHSRRYATIANYSQAKVCDNRDCDNRNISLDARMEPEDIKAELHRRGMSQRDLAQAVGMDENHLSKALGRTRKFTVPEMDAIRAELAPEDGSDDRLPIRTIPLLGDVPAGRFEPQEQKGGRRLIASDPDIPPRAYGLTVKGDSMDLIVPSGSTVIIDPDDKTLWPGFRYVVRSDDGETTFKEYQEGPSRLVPCSSNLEHRDILLGGEPVVIEGRVFSYMMRDVPRRAS